MNLRIRFYDRATNKQTEMEIPNDVMEITIPRQEGLPAIKVNVNTDAVIIDTKRGQRLGGLTYSDLFYELVSARPATGRARRTRTTG